MPATRTPLTSILNRMKRYSFAKKVLDADLVRDLDEAIREKVAEFRLPFMLKKSQIRVFKDVDEYPVESDFLAIGYLRKNKDNNDYYYSPGPKYTNLVDFKQNRDNGNYIAEIWENGNVVYGIKSHEIHQGSIVLEPCETITNFSVSGTASNLVLDSVNYKKGNSSVRFDATAGTATVSNSLSSSLTDSDYRRKYHFKFIYLPSVPTSITLRLAIDGSNYLETTGITTQFSGRPLQAGTWNLVAHDLNLATVTGTIGTNPTFTSETISLVGASSGTYYLDESSVKAWELWDNHYYSSSIISTSVTGAPTQLTFYETSSDVLSNVDSFYLVCEDVFISFLIFNALTYTAMSLENTKAIEFFSAKSEKAFQNLKNKYPSIEQFQQTSYYFYDSNYGHPSKPHYQQFEI